MLRERDLFLSAQGHDSLAALRDQNLGPELVFISCLSRRDAVHRVRRSGLSGSEVRKKNISSLKRTIWSPASCLPFSAFRQLCSATSGAGTCPCSGKPTGGELSPLSSRTVCNAARTTGRCSTRELPRPHMTWTPRIRPMTVFVVPRRPRRHCCRCWFRCCCCCCCWCCCCCCRWRCCRCRCCCFCCCLLLLLLLLL